MYPTAASAVAATSRASRSRWRAARRPWSIANCSFALTVAISIGSGMELVNVRKLAAVVAALAAVILLGIAAEQDAADAERRGKHGKGRLLHSLL